VLLPGHTEADKITAALADGVLTVTVPMADVGKPRRIQITAGWPARPVRPVPALRAGQDAGDTGQAPRVTRSRAAGQDAPPRQHRKEVIPGRPARADDARPALRPGRQSAPGR
jgi:Hsp20/alpha crystallin family protein